MSRRGGVKEGLVKDQTFAAFLGNCPKLNIMNWLSCTIQLISQDLLLHFVLLAELVGFSKHGSALNLVLSSPLGQPCIWPDNRKMEERGMGRGEENPNKGSGTKVGQFAGQS